MGEMLTLLTGFAAVAQLDSWVREVGFKRACDVVAVFLLSYLVAKHGGEVGDAGRGKQESQPPVAELRIEQDHH